MDNLFYLILFFYTTFLNTSSGELFNTPRILLNPIASTNTEIPGKNTRKGTRDGTKGSLKTKRAKSKLLTEANRIPTKLPRIPKNKYSSAEILRICLFFAPRVRNNTLSLIRWYLLVRTEPINTIIPVRILKKAIKLMIHETLSNMSSTTV